MKLYRIIIIVLLVTAGVFTSTFIKGQTSIVDYVMGTNSVVVAYEPTSKCDWFDTVVHDDDRGVYYEQCMNNTASVCTVVRPKSGHYTVLVRACRNGTCNDAQGNILDPCCSDWSLSTDATKALRSDGTPGGWRVYWKPKAPGTPSAPGAPHF